MVLSSQQTRPGSTRSYMYARRQKSPRRWVVFLIVIGAVVVGWYFGPWRDSEGGTLNTGDDNLASRENSDPTFEDPNTQEMTERIAGAMDSPVSSDPPVEDGDESMQDDSRTMSLPSGDMETAPNTLTGSMDQGSDDGEGDSPPAIVMGEPTTEAGDEEPTGSGAEEAAAPLNTPALQVGGLNAEVEQLIQGAERFVSQNRLVDARTMYNTALHHPQAESVAPEIRDRMTEINAILVFSPTIDERDPFVVKRLIQSGDRLSIIGRDYGITDDFIARINGLKDKNQIRAGVHMKMIQGPFHAVVSKDEFRLDLYLGDPDANGNRMYVRSFLVGLGEYNSTPIGSWVVSRGGKVKNPDWRNPRTGEYFKPDDPKNPIGEYWIGLTGADSETSLLSGYGIHGTVDPSSIGREASMGCVRMRDEDIPLVFEVLYETRSTVEIAH